MIPISSRVSRSLATSNSLQIRSCTRSTTRIHALRSVASSSSRTYATPASDLGPNHVTIVEVGPRDGLQNEKSVIPPSVKIELVERLGRAGLTHLEAGSFVSPKWVPQVRFRFHDVMRIIYDASTWLDRWQVQQKS